MVGKDNIQDPSGTVNTISNDAHDPLGTRIDIRPNPGTFIKIVAALQITFKCKDSGGGGSVQDTRRVDGTVIGHTGWVGHPGEILEHTP